jgi:hypothetical protein
MDTPTSSLKSLTTLCLESLARSIGKQDLSALPGDLSERLQATLISMNALNDDTLVSSTSINQTCLNIPFFISNDTQESNGPSPASVLAAIKVRASQTLYFQMTKTLVHPFHAYLATKMLHRRPISVEFPP